MRAYEEDAVRQGVKQGEQQQRSAHFGAQGSVKRITEKQPCR